MNGNGTDTVLPRRISARKATAAFADQLTDSGSEGSDDEEGSSTRKRRVSVKKKCGKKTKTTNGSISTEQSEATGQTAKKPRPSSPRPMPAATLSAPMSASVAPSNLRPRPRPVINKPTSLLHPVVVTSLPQTDNDLSDLTPISSDDSSSSIEIVEDPNPKPRVSISAPFLGRFKATSSSGPSTGRKEPAWAQAALGTYVWVLIDPKSSSVDNGEHDGNEDKLWWPGKITSPRPTSVPLEIKLFGPGRGSVQVDKPSHANVLSRLDHLYRQRFTTPTFVSPSLSYIDLSSPKKKHKPDRITLERKWQAAVEEVAEDMKRVHGNGDDSDELPEVGNIFDHIPSAPPIPTFSQSASKDTVSKKGKRKRKDSTDISAHDDTDNFFEEEEDLWVPPNFDDLDIPGELVLARDKPSKTVSYWPARLEKYIPPKGRKDRPKFVVIWLDDSRGEIERSWFYTMQEGGFATCKLGQFESTIIEVQNDEDDEHPALSKNYLALRSPSPDISDTPISAKEFTDLTIRQQFVYTKDVLKAIINEEYEPAKNAHDWFIKGGKQRQAVANNAFMRGKMDPQHVQKLGDYVLEWCLRDEGRVSVPQDDEIDSHLYGTTVNATHNGEETVDFTTVSTSRSLIDVGSTRSASPLPTEDPPSSPLQFPPSSLPSSKTEDEGSVISDISVVPSDSPCFAIKPLARTEYDILKLSNSDHDEPVSTGGPNLSRQRGSEDFESLPALAKVDYCVNILLPEAVRQILLWREGYRTSTALLSSAEEEELYQRGEELLKERDWVNDIMRYRAMCKNLEKRDMKSRKHGVHGRNDSHGGSRPRRQGPKPNYVE